MIIAAGTIVSSLQCDRLTRKMGTGKVTTFSVLLTAAALFGFSISHSFAELCLWAVPYGLGAGCVDASLNNYVALHYASRHMGWLHCMWGVGASVGPYIMGFALFQAETENRLQDLPLKERAAGIAELIQELARQKGISLKLRKKG